MTKKKKEENTLSYLQMPLPSGGKYSKMTKISFGGLNKRHTIDSGDLSMESNISSKEYPYLTPSEQKNIVSDEYDYPISMFAFDNFILVVYRQNGAVKIDYITEDYDVYTGVLKESGATSDDDYPRSIVQFNVYEQSNDIVNGKYTKKLLIFPDKMTMDFEITANFTPDRMTNSTMPNIKYATVHLSRLFGVSDDTVYASGFNDYANWTFDDALSYNESNAWMSKTQSNTKADGNFTGIINFQGHIVCFKRDYMHEIYNTKNPFRIQDIYAEGTIDNRTIQDVDGKLIFVSEDDVKIYTGSNPRIIGYNLNMSQYEYAVSGNDNRSYYLYCEDNKGNRYLYVYDTYTELWSEQSIHSRVLSFAHNKNGMYMLCVDGYVYQLDTDRYGHSWSFETELITNKTVDIKHIKKLQMLVDIPEYVNNYTNYAETTDKLANMQVYILYDNEVFVDMNPSERAKRLVYSSNKHGKFPIRVKLRKTANYGFKLHIEGAGYVKIHELEIFVESGGDLYV